MARHAVCNEGIKCKCKCPVCIRAWLASQTNPLDTENDDGGPASDADAIQRWKEQS